MKTICISFFQMVRCVSKDAMLWISCLVPLLMGAAFKWGIPMLELALASELGKSAVMAPYYSLFDLLLAIMTPMMFSFAGGMVVLEELDEHIARYFAVTPLGKHGYIVSRLAIPLLLSVVANIFCLSIFGISGLTFPKIFWLSLASAGEGLLVMLLIVTISSNKLDGMAVTKISSLLSLGLFAPYFLSGGARYFLMWMPTYWIASAITQNSLWHFGIALLLAAIGSYIFTKFFLRKLAH